MFNSTQKNLFNNFSLSLENVFDRLEMADLYQIKSLYSSCGQLIRRNIKTVKKDAKWLELKKKTPELAFSILEQIVEEFENRNDMHPSGSRMSGDAIIVGNGPPNCAQS
jgi:hypothetical protein